MSRVGSGEVKTQLLDSAALAARRVEEEKRRRQEEEERRRKRGAEASAREKKGVEHLKRRQPRVGMFFIVSKELVETGGVVFTGDPIDIHE
eukprot:2249947-Rhodomonas_salina.1